MRVYLAGPMTGIEAYNFPAFHAAARDWRECGWDVFNPAEEFGGDTSLPYCEYVRHDIAELKRCDAIALLPGWDGPNARGSVWEAELARTWGLYILDATKPEWAGAFAPRRESITAEADRLVNGPRQHDYGHPIEDFTRTGRMWGAILGTDDVPPEKVALCMVALKISRECHRPKRDNLVDGAGYFATLELVRERQGKA